MPDTELDMLLRRVEHWRKNSKQEPNWLPIAKDCLRMFEEFATELRAARERYRWRPIAELHEDYGPCVLMHIPDPGYLEIGTNTDIDFDESQWTHFSQITPLSIEDGERMLAEHHDRPAGGAA